MHRLGTPKTPNSRLLLREATCYHESCEKLRNLGVEFTDKPTDRPCGIDCGLCGPFGDHIRFTQPKA
jgi:hypothetical protein